MNKIQENLKTYMSDPHAVIINSGIFRVIDFINLNKVLNGTTEDFLIFDNAGGRMFDIMFGDQQNKVKEFIDYLLREHKGWIYCYQINGEQTVLRKII